MTLPARPALEPMTAAHPNPCLRRAVTLVEMLIAMVITLIMMGGVITMFGTVSGSIGTSRSAIEMSDRLRAARNRLQADLAGVTATTLPPLRPESDEGYFEYVEGPQWDCDPSWMSDSGRPMVIGDVDDILAFTTRSRGEPFVGRFGSGTMESQVAEVVWFTALSTDATGTPTAQVIDVSTGTRVLTLYRRVLLVAPQAPVPAADLSGSLADFQTKYDLSARQEVVNGPIILNTLGDLTKRENRFARTRAFPFPHDGTRLVPFAEVAGSLSRFGEDVVLNNVTGFDLRAFDPAAPLRLTDDGSTVVGPCDIGFSTAGQAAGAGAFVDLYYKTRAFGSPVTSYFSDPPQTKSGLGMGVYDTWSLHYEQDGVLNNPGMSAFDQGVNGFDDDNNGVVDDLGEFDTLPPYPYPLRGIQIKLRTYEPDSRLVREVTVAQDFLPE